METGYSNGATSLAKSPGPLANVCDAAPELGFHLYTWLSSTAGVRVPAQEPQPHSPSGFRDSMAESALALDQGW